MSFFNLKTPYDLKSIMQYSSLAFSLNKSMNLFTIESKNEPKQIPFNIKMSEIDIKEIRMLYKCS
jgi:hypothetical protein